MYPSILGHAYNQFGYNEHPATTSRFLCVKIIDCNVKKFDYNKNPLITNSFFCICLLIVGRDPVYIFHLWEILPLWGSEQQGCVYTRRGRSFFYEQCHHSIWISTLKPIRKWHSFRICIRNFRIQVFVQTLQKIEKFHTDVNTTAIVLLWQKYYQRCQFNR